MLFKNKEMKNKNMTKKQEIKKFKKEMQNKQANVIDNFNQVVDIQNGFFITKNKEVIFVFQLENIDYNLLSKENKFNTRKLMNVLLIILKKGKDLLKILY